MKVKRMGMEIPVTKNQLNKKPNSSLPYFLLFIVLSCCRFFLEILVTVSADRKGC